MKVKDLEIGMLLRPTHDKHFNAHNDEWLWVSDPAKRRRPSHWNNMRPVPATPKKDIALYLGTKKDIGFEVRVTWSDRYVLFQNKVLAVDPYVWRHIEPVEK